VATINNWVAVEPDNDMDLLYNSVQDHGPNQVALCMAEELAQYSSGIFTGDCDGCNGGTNHAVACIGYGSECGTGKAAFDNNYNRNSNHFLFPERLLDP